MIADLKKTGSIIPTKYSRKKGNTRASPNRHQRCQKTALYNGISRIQIDVDEYHEHDMRWYHFSAIHIDTRWAWARAYSQRTVENAIDFLMRIRASLPIGLTFDAIQVDGGGEFMQDFAIYCKKEGVMLIVNRPYTPTQNCYVERLHRTCDEEMYQVRRFPNTLSNINEELEDYIELYNFYRPHAGIDYKTPHKKLQELIALQKRAGPT